MNQESEMKRMRQRAANFTKTEVAVLMHLIKKYKDTVDSKLTGATSNKMKDQAWDNITKEFNASPATRQNPRTVHTLRKKYENMKKIMRRKKLQEGPRNEENSTVRYERDEDFNETMDFKEEISSEDWNQVQESNSSCSSETVPVMPKPKYDITKQDICELQKRCFLEEHSLKLQHMQEKHERALRIQEEEAEEKLKQMREEHKLQMEILQLRKQCLLK